MTTEINWEQVALKFAPILHFHPDEVYFPCTIEFLLNRSNLRDEHSNVVKAMPLSQEDLVTHNDESKFIQIDYSIYEGQGETLAQVPFYVHCEPDLDSPGAYRLKYCFLYTFNAPYRYACNQGGHVYDLEHVDLHIDSTLQHVTKMYYGAHGSKQGTWLRPDQVEWTESTHPVVYVSKGSHACYNTPETRWRIFGLANDKCARGGRVWSPEHITLIDENTPWNAFKGGYEAPRMGSPPLRQFWWVRAPAKSASSFVRCCLPWML